MAKRLPFYATNLRLRRLNRQSASYSLIGAERASTAGFWFAGINGAALVLSFAFMIQAYLSLKGDCVTRLFVADAMLGAKILAAIHILGAVFALIAAWLPAAVGICRNWRRKRHNPQQPPLQPGDGFEGWSEGRVNGAVFWQIYSLSLSGLLFGLSLYLIVEVVPTKPDAAWQLWNGFEKKCGWPSGITQ